MSEQQQQQPATAAAAAVDTQETFLGAAQGWTSEAEAVIRDVRALVKAISIASNLQSTSCQIYLNVTTLEEQPFTVELSAQGFRIVGHDHDLILPESKDTECDATFFETPYSLLSSISAGYARAFGECLVSRLDRLQQEQQEQQGQPQREAADM